MQVAVTKLMRSPERAGKFKGKGRGKGDSGKSEGKSSDHKQIHTFQQLIKVDKRTRPKFHDDAACLKFQEHKCNKSPSGAERVYLTTIAGACRPELSTPEVVPHYLLEMSFSSISQADPEKAWLLQRQVNDLFPSFVIIYFDFDKQLDLPAISWAVLGFFLGVILGPPPVSLLTGKTRW